MADATKTGAWKNLTDAINMVVLTVAAFAQAASGFTLLGRVRQAGTVASVTYYPNAAMAGHAADTRRFRLYNRTTGAGTTLIADLQLGAGNNPAAKTAKVITLTVTTADLAVAAGDLLEFKSDAVGAGIADPGGLVEVIITPTVG